MRLGDKYRLLFALTCAILHKTIERVGVLMRRLTVPVCMIAVLLMMSACTRMKNVKMIDGDTFVREAQAMGFTVEDRMTDAYLGDFYSLLEAAGEGVYIQFFHAKDDTTANYLYSDEYAIVTASLAGEDLTDEVSDYQYSRLTVTHVGGQYVAIIRSGGTYMYLEATPVGRAAAETFLRAISY